ncbi:hypothetical protein ACFWN7_05600 [Agromyces sp. NPDC058484]|uniref:hypothetical protein n=1 Tax=Agromyces sp. NPDC058484 TaxID=3346524 RepID=UPI003654B2EE
MWQRLLHLRLAVEDAAARTQAYILGNIAVLATVVVVGRDSEHLADGVLLLACTVLVTFAAHVVAEAYANRVRSGRRPDRSSIVHSGRDSLPIVSSGIFPVLVLWMAAAGAVPFTAGFILAIASVIARFLFLGAIIGRLRGESSSWRTQTAGVVLALLGVLLAGAELLLAH